MRCQRRKWASKREGIGTVGCRLFVFALRSCPGAWCSWVEFTTFAGMGRVGQLAIAGKLTAGSSLNGAMVSSVM